MLDFLENYISVDTMKKMEKLHSSQLFNLNCNQKECISIIDFFKELGINNIDDLLINRIEVFFETRQDLEDKFLRYNISNLVEKINDDYMQIDVIFE